MQYDAVEYNTVQHKTFQYEFSASTVQYKTPISIQCNNSSTGHHVKLMFLSMYPGSSP